MKSFFGTIYNADSYKLSHSPLYAPETSYNHSYLEARGCDIEGYDSTMFAGLGYIVKKTLGRKVTLAEIKRAKKKSKVHGEPFNEEAWKLVVKEYGGKLPITIRAVPEGTVVKLKNVLMTVVSSAKPEHAKQLAFLVSYVETFLERVWYPMAVATQGFFIKKDIYKYLDETSDNADALIDFMLQDFGSRGVTCEEQAGIGGYAHLINFKGTDTLTALDMVEYYYHDYCAGFSVAAAEHSTFSSWGKDREVDAYRNMLRVYGKKGAIVSAVSDTWDVYNACENIWGKELKQEVIDSGCKLVSRLDSGNPVEVALKCLDLLGAGFGTTVNSKGYKILNHMVKILPADGMNRAMIPAILEALKQRGWSAENIACFGMGGQLLQSVTRDTFKVAYKESYTINDRGGVDVYKDPITDPGKTSKKGRLDLILVNGEYETVKLEEGVEQHPDSVLVTYYKNGEILVDDTLEQIRERANLAFRKSICAQYLVK